MRLLLTLLLIFCFALPSLASAEKGGQDEGAQVMANIESTDSDSKTCHIVGTMPVSGDYGLYFHLGDKLYFADDQRNLWLVEQETIDIFSGEGCPPPEPYDD